MKVTCKNVNCKNYYLLKDKEHCPAEEVCEEYTANKKKAENSKIKCKDCKYCKLVYTNGMKEYHYECHAEDKPRILLMIENRVCSCRQ